LTILSIKSAILSIKLTILSIKLTILSIKSASLSLQFCENSAPARPEPAWRWTGRLFVCCYLACKDYPVMKPPHAAARPRAAAA
jgi:hypothetical protein